MKIYKATGLSETYVEHAECEIWAYSKQKNSPESIHISIAGQQVAFHGTDAKKLMKFLEQRLKISRQKDEK